MSKVVNLIAGTAVWATGLTEHFDFDAIANLKAANIVKWDIPEKNTLNTVQPC